MPVGNACRVLLAATAGSSFGQMPRLKGGRYFVVAKIPDALTTLTPVPQSSTFQPFSTTVDVTSQKQTVRMGVAVGRKPPEPAESQPTSVSRASDRPGLARFAVGDLVWMDDNRAHRIPAKRRRVAPASSCSMLTARSSHRR